MPRTKKIVCLANSRRVGGFCFAGKEVLDHGYGEWVRPVSGDVEGAISLEQQRFSDGGCPELLDVVEVPLLERKPMHHQRENYLIQAGAQWRKIGTVNPQELPSLLDSLAADHWLHRWDRCVPFEDAVQLTNSLVLVQPGSLTITAKWSDPYDGGPPKIRVNFRLRGRDHSLPVTDPVAEKKYRDRTYGDVPSSLELAGRKACLCISLAEKHSNDRCYMLAAAIIGDD